MNIKSLEKALVIFKTDLENAIRSAKYNGKSYENGQKAKEALIRSQNLIMNIHEVVKESLCSEVSGDHRIHPPLGRRSPEKKIFGFIKAKQQDVVLFKEPHVDSPEIITEGPLQGETDPIGKNASEKSIVVGIRSQMSSVAKNFDTLMERAFAETLNLRLRLPNLVMGEVYLLPVYEYDDNYMIQNKVKMNTSPVPIERFIKTFLASYEKNYSSIR